jgi:hypothetical protein
MSADKASRIHPMSDLLRNCGSCGGRFAQSADGRVVACMYCGSTSSVAVDPRALAAGIAVDAKTLSAGFEGLLAIFQQTLPQQTTVSRSGLLFKKVNGFDVTLDELTFRLTRSGDKLVAQRVATVGGIRLKTETMPLEAWITALAEQLAEMASQSGAARDAFARLPRGN